ncbi:MAG: DeoR/GlpR transcriptional regulator [Clostridia bacterium]|nr:DeoR/GlpR transcriptional regulator [Clostridia bacterium]
MGGQRREIILDLLREKGYVKLHALEEMFPDVSSMTLRRDIEFLENIGEAAKVRGGAKYIGNRTDVEDVYELREVRNRAAKEKIAAAALRYAETGCSMFIDSGTTGMIFAKALPDTPYYILTSGPNVACELAKRFKPSVTIVGGQVSRNTLSVSGGQSLDFIRNFNIEIAFLAASAFSVENGFTVGNADECELKKAVVAKAKKKIVLCDSAKLEKSMPFTFASLEDIDIIITEREPDKAVLAAAEASGTEIVW